MRVAGERLIGVERGTEPGGDVYGRGLEGLGFWCIEEVVAELRLVWEDVVNGKGGRRTVVETAEVGGEVETVHVDAVRVSTG